MTTVVRVLVIPLPIPLVVSLAMDQMVQPFQQSVWGSDALLILSR